ncbi:hypothetical protein IG631_12606 [Alternaria alternata]|nr:hypothetical protein IG631_12606 [Alternaria alternata]
MLATKINDRNWDGDEVSSTKMRQNERGMHWDIETSVLAPTHRCRCAAHVSDPPTAGARHLPQPSSLLHLIRRLVSPMPRRSNLLAIKYGSAKKSLHTFFGPVARPRTSR